jgi:hypothetical protein
MSNTNNTLDLKKILQLDEQFSAIKRISFENNNIVFFKDYEKFLTEYANYSSDDITTAVSDGIVKCIPQCDGSKNLASIGGVLQPNKLSIDDKRINNAGSPTGETKIEIRKVIKNSTFGNVFYSFKKDLNDLCFTQHQITVLFEKYRHRLNPDGRNAFLSKVDNQFVIFNLFTSLDDEKWIYHLLEFEEFKKSELFSIHKQFLVIPTYEAKLK